MPPPAIICNIRGSHPRLSDPSFLLFEVASKSFLPKVRDVLHILRFGSAKTKSGSSTGPERSADRVQVTSVRLKCVILEGLDPYMRGKKGENKVAKLLISP